jgi:asparagine synthase (glutamine-hydrolysing)
MRGDRIEWSGGPVGLGVEGARPPAAFASWPRHGAQTPVAVLAGLVRLHARDEVRAAVGDGFGAPEPSDAELVLGAYLRFGESFTERVRGDYSLCIWDGRRQCVVCARDPFGVRPMFLHLSANRLVVGSDIAGVLAHPGVSDGLDRLRVGAMLAWRHQFFSDRERTFYSEVRRLDPTQVLIAERESVRTVPAWLPRVEVSRRVGSVSSRVERFRAALDGAVRGGLSDCIAPGFLLSGGLDSSSIAATARQQLLAKGRDTATFSAVFPSLAADHPGSDEGGFAQEVASGEGWEPHWVEADGLGPLSGAARIAELTGEPTGAPNVYMDVALFAAARSAGVRELFTGLDGDSVVGHGFGDFYYWVKRGQLLTAVREARLLSQKPVSKPASARAILWKLAVRPLLRQAVPPLVRELRARRRGFSSPDPLAATVLDPVFAAECGLLAAIGEARGREESGGGGIALWRRRGIFTPMVQYQLEVLGAAASSLGLDLRHPFYDLRFVEHCLEIPLGLRLRDGWTRWILRAAMEGVLPPRVQWRIDKSDISAGFITGLVRHDRELLDEALGSGAERIAPYVDRTRLGEAYRRVVNGTAEGNDDYLNVFLAAELSLWLASRRPKQRSDA